MVTLACFKCDSVTWESLLALFGFVLELFPDRRIRWDAWSWWEVPTRLPKLLAVQA